MTKSFGKSFKSSLKEEEIEKYAQHEAEIPVVPVRVTELSDEEMISHAKERNQIKNFRSLISPASVGISIRPFVLPSQRSKQNSKILKTKTNLTPS